MPRAVRFGILFRMVIPLFHTAMWFIGLMIGNPKLPINKQLGGRVGIINVHDMGGIKEPKGVLMCIRGE